MEEITSQRMLARLDRLDKFFAQCPGTKRGRPMDPGQAIHQEKANPGSVCMKISRARDGRGQRHIFYKVHSRAERAAQKIAQPAQNKKHEIAEGQKPKASGQQSARATANPRTSSETPTFKSGVQGQSALQQKWGKVFHHQLERSLRGYIDSVMKGDSPEKAYVKEAWANLAKLDKAGSVFGLKGLSPKSIFWAMLTPESAKVLAGRIGKDLTSMSDGPAFARIIRSKFKDDPSFQAALAKGEAWPVSSQGDKKQPTQPAQPAQPTPLSRMGKMKAKASQLITKGKAKAIELKAKAMKAKEAADEWQKKHPVLSVIGKGAAKIGLGSLGLMQAQYPDTQTMLDRLDEHERLLKFYGHCPS